MTATQTARWLTLPYPPSTNNLFNTVVSRKTGNAIRIKSALAKGYALEVGMMARSAFHEPLQGRLQVSVVLYPKRGIGIDIDNALKAILDAMTGIAWKDDSQVWRIEIERAEPCGNGAAAVCIEPFEATL